MKRSQVLLWGLVLAISLTVGCASNKQITAEPQSPSVVPAEPVQAPEPVVKRPEKPKPAPVAPTAPATIDKPVIAFEKTVHDFGSIGPSSSHSTEFKFTNTGNAVLNIERFHTPCGCTIPELTKREYQPGESGEIKVRYNAPSGAATVSKPIYIYSNDPVQPQFELTITAKVTVNVEVSPIDVSLFLDQDNAGMPKLVVKSTDGKEFAIISATATSGVMEIPFDKAKRGAELTLEPKVNLDKLTATPSGLIQIRTDHPQSGLMIVRFTAKPLFDVSNPRIIIQNFVPGEEMTREVWIRSNYDKKVEIASYSSTNGMMSIADQRQDGNHLQITIKIVPRADASASSRRYINDELKIKLTCGQEISIKLNGWFR